MSTTAKSLLDSALNSRKKDGKKSKGKGKKSDLDMDLDDTSAESSPEAKKALRAKRRMNKSEKETPKSRKTDKKVAKKPTKAEKPVKGKKSSKKEVVKGEKKAKGKSKPFKFDALKSLSNKAEKAGKFDASDTASIARHLVAAVQKAMRSSVNETNVAKTLAAASKDGFGVSLKPAAFAKPAAEIYSVLLKRIATATTKALNTLRKVDDLDKDAVEDAADTIVNGDED
jgi:hypothetical protein